MKKLFHPPFWQLRVSILPFKPRLEWTLEGGMRECLHVAGAGRLYSEASNVPHVARGRVSKVFVLIAYTIYIIGILSAGPHVAVRSLFPAEMNVPHVACNVWLSGITDGFTYEKYILLYSIYAEPHVASNVRYIALQWEQTPYSEESEWIQKKRWLRWINHRFVLGYPDSNQERQDQNL